MNGPGSQREGDMAIEEIRADDLRRLLRERREDLEIIDVRGEKEFEIVRIRGSKLIPMNELPRRADEIDWSREVVFVCRSGKRSQLIAGMASAGGADVRNLSFGIFECIKDGKGEFLEGSKGEAERYF